MSSSERSGPLLLPQNRRIRHLQGIYLRNLTLTRPRGHTIDDAALDKSPSKLEVLHEPQLHHAQSSDALNMKGRPGKQRRRSTIWAGQSPGYRQKKLEDVIGGGMTDSFFSLHVEQINEPVYVSEVVEKAMNPTFRFFDLSIYSPSITRHSTITVKFWVKREDFYLLLEQRVDLRSLYFIGTLQNRNLPPNCMIFHLIDGIYAFDMPITTPSHKPMPFLPTSSYSALMRLSSLDDSIQDALATREVLASQINAILQKQSPDESPQAEDEASLAGRYTSSERKLLKQTLKKRSELKLSLAARRRAIEEGTAAQRHVQENVNNAAEKLKQCQDLLRKATEDIHGQRRRICEELLHIFPLEPTNEPLLFTIDGLPLPNTSFEEADEDVVAAALGHVARLVDMLQYYLGVPLPYPVTAYGSRSIIRDEISVLTDTQRTFPLFIKGVVRYRFDYGVFLLNKNIDCLAESQGLKVIDIRHTLPNLKYLLYVCSAGSSELPARKAGGIRGLLSGRVTPALSRRESEESVDKRQDDIARKALDDKGIDQGKGKSLETILPFKDQSTSLRTRGLRENIVR